MGRSLAPLLRQEGGAEDTFHSAFSQYARNADGSARPSECIEGEDGCYMGYSITTKHEGTKYRYTE